ncbi:hypothetical protein HK102_001788 [Quaeritorhiza haematococci]|nr:hypothetical protein HK102_001788 [Quaeritorhiza haematococci]
MARQAKGRTTKPSSSTSNQGAATKSQPKIRVAKESETVQESESKNKRRARGEDESEQDHSDDDHNDGNDENNDDNVEPPKQLFVDDDGKPLLFFVARGAHRERAVGLIERHGGKITPNDKQAFMCLGSPDTSYSSTDIYDVAYVDECIQRESLLPKRLYQIVKMNDQPTGTRKTWVAVRFYGAGRDKDLLTQLIVENWNGDIRGNVLYKKLAEKHTQHTWMSWRDHAVKTMLREVPVEIWERRHQKYVEQRAKKIVAELDSTSSQTASSTASGSSSKSAAGRRRGRSATTGSAASNDIDMEGSGSNVETGTSSKTKEGKLPGSSAKATGAASAERDSPSPQSPQGVSGFRSKSTGKKGQGPSTSSNERTTNTRKPTTTAASKSKMPAASSSQRGTPQTNSAKGKKTVNRTPTSEDENEELSASASPTYTPKKRKRTTAVSEAQEGEGRPSSSPASSKQKHSEVEGDKQQDEADEEQPAKKRVANRGNGSPSKKSIRQQQDSEREEEKEEREGDQQEEQAQAQPTDDSSDVEPRMKGYTSMEEDFGTQPDHLHLEDVDEDVDVDDDDKEMDEELSKHAVKSARNPDEEDMEKEEEYKPLSQERSPQSQDDGLFFSQLDRGDDIIDPVNLSRGRDVSPSDKGSASPAGKKDEKDGSRSGASISPSKAKSAATRQDKVEEDEDDLAFTKMDTADDIVDPLRGLDARRRRSSGSGSLRRTSSRQSGAFSMADAEEEANGTDAEGVDVDGAEPVVIPDQVVMTYDQQVQHLIDDFPDHSPREVLSAVYMCSGYWTKARRLLEVGLEVSKLDEKTRRWVFTEDEDRKLLLLDQKNDLKGMMRLRKEKGRTAVLFRQRFLFASGADVDGV